MTPDERYENSGELVISRLGIRARGEQVVLAILLFLGFLGLGYINYTGFESLRVHLIQQDKEISDRATEHRLLIEEMVNLVYILSLPQEQRPRLLMPQSLRRRILEQELEGKR